MVPNNPKLLDRVIDIITDLDYHNGASYKAVLENVQDEPAKYIVEKLIRAEVKKALRHGVNNGLLKFRQGRYSMALYTDKEYKQQFRRHRPKSHRRSSSEYEAYSNYPSALDASSSFGTISLEDCGNDTDVTYAEKRKSSILKPKMKSATVLKSNSKRKPLVRKKPSQNVQRKKRPKRLKRPRKKTPGPGAETQSTGSDKLSEGNPMWDYLK